MERGFAQPVIEKYREAQRVELEVERVSRKMAEEDAALCRIPTSHQGWEGQTTLKSEP